MPLRHLRPIEQRLIIESALRIGGCTQTDLARLLGVDRTLVSRWKAGDRQMDGDHALAIARAVGSLDVLACILDEDDQQRVDRLQEVRIQAAQAVAFASEALQATADGVLDADEEARLSALATGLAGSLRRS